MLRLFPLRMCVDVLEVSTTKVSALGAQAVPDKCTSRHAELDACDRKAASAEPVCVQDRCATVKELERLSAAPAFDTASMQRCSPCAFMNRLPVRRGCATIKLAYIGVAKQRARAFLCASCSSWPAQVVNVPARCWGRCSFGTVLVGHRLPASSVCADFCAEGERHNIR